MRYHLEQKFHASRVYIIASGSLARNTDKIVKLLKAIGDSKVVGLRKGTTRHMPWSEILSIAAGLLTLTPSLHSGLVAQLTQILSFGFVTTWTFADKVPLEHRVASSAFDFHPACPECLANDITEPFQLARYSAESWTLQRMLRSPRFPS